MNKSSPKFTSQGSKFKNKVQEITKQLTVIDKLAEGSPKQQFIDEYGIQLEMPAKYIFKAFFYKPDMHYLITAYIQVYPQDIQFLNYSMIDQNEDPRDNDYLAQQKDQNDCLCFKVYGFENDRYAQNKNLRKCDLSYQNKMCFSDDCKRVAIYRLHENNEHLINKFLGNQKRYVIDIFDCSNIDFFLRQEILTNKDPNLIFTIQDDQLLGASTFESSSFQFSSNYKYLQVIEQRKIIHIYDLQDKDIKLIKQEKIQATLPHNFEIIVTFSIDEDRLNESLVAAKRTDFRNIDIFPLQMIIDIMTRQQELSKINLIQKEYLKIAAKYPISSIRLQSFDIKTTSLKFSADMTQAIYCNYNQSTLLLLAEDGMSQHQIDINHLDGKISRHIATYGDSEFLIATANAQDKSICVRHSSDANKKIKFYFRFKEGVTDIRDIYSYQNKVRILVTRDDEEFIIYEYENFQTKETFWQRFYESSNYIFEWPYLCYLKGQRHILIQNAFNTELAFYLELEELYNEGDPNAFISNMFLSDKCLLYVIIQTSKQYIIYEQDLDKCMPYIFDRKKHTGGENTPIKSMVTRVQSTFRTKQNTPIARIFKDQIQNKSIYKFYVRSQSTKEIIQTNEDRIIFFLCDFKIYGIIDGKLRIIDSGYKIREIQYNLLAYNTVDENKKKTNEIKYLRIGHSDCQSYKVFQETDGKLIEFLVQEGKLLILNKPEKSEQYLIKIYDINQNYQIKLKYVIPTTDENLIGNLQTINYFQGSMIPAGNELYNLVFNGEKYVIHHFKNIIPILPQYGNQLAFYSPLMNTDYRKMIYFVTNKVQMKTKRAIIIPFLGDNFSVFNKRTNITQFCQFYEYVHPEQNQKILDVLCLIPYIQRIFHYNLKGQLVSSYHMKNDFQTYGEMTLALSQNGKTFLQTFEEDITRSNFHILKIYIKSIGNQKSSNQRSNEQSSNKVWSMKTFKKLHTFNFANQQSELKVTMLEHIQADKIRVNDSFYAKINKFYLNEIINYYNAKGCEVLYKMNDHMDILIGFVYSSQALGHVTNNNKYLKELLLLKRYDDSKRVVFRVRINQDEEQQGSKLAEIIGFNLQEKLLEGKQNQNQPSNQTAEQEFFGDMQPLKQCYNFIVTNDKVILWSKSQVYHGDLKFVNSNSHQITLKQIETEIENKDEAQIVSVNAYGQNDEDIRMGNYYIYIKIEVDNSYSFITKYNILKDKEFSSFDCSKQAQIFFDTKCEGYILDDDSIIDIDQGTPLYHYKTGMDNYQIQYLFGQKIDKGSRFCSKNQHFLIRNKFFIPYSFFSLVQMESQKEKGLTLNNDIYDPEAIYYYEGQSVLHEYANNYKPLEFILNKYQQTNQKLLNMIFIKDDQGNNVLQKAIKYGNTRCVKLILDKLASVSMNNIHAVKQNFVDLLDYNGFEEYLRLCFFQTLQMQNKQIFQRKSKVESLSYFIAPHSTSFLDSKFHKNFQDTTQPMKQVVMKALDAGWILRTDAGIEFQIKLSESENMDYFAIETIQLLVNYQWNIMKPLLIKWLFIPFIINMVVYSYFSVSTYETQFQDDYEGEMQGINITVQVAILIFAFQTLTIEYRQMKFHKKEYLKSFWNLLDLSTVILAPFTVIMSQASVDQAIVRPFMAICNLIFYMRFFYFLRIFDNSLHLVRTIIEITYDIRNFLFVFFLGIIGFGTSFLILSNNNSKETQGAVFLQSFQESFIFSYRMALGDFQLDGFPQATDQFLIYSLFVICSLFSAVILLNMLVAIMGESFNRVNESSENQIVREHLQLIVENDFLFDRKKEFSNVKYLIEIKDDIEEDDKDVIHQKIDQIKSLINQASEDSLHQSQEIKEILLGNDVKFQQLRNQINKLTEQQRMNINETNETLHSQSSFILSESQSILELSSKRY
ncbi:wd-40 repeat protein [Stylonychia lemnae]|uniref:Wd-40 repeat protein n=1 Tax=Stylonychia lemnae TaxID=5949 RepID=A0A078AA52_STYLE|nr:wd-40 repeat protein [Stylonychia lemnae]|eukprot:CDW78432.1 wd-40 repeat protein [Stylonychia lemnae]